MLTPTTYRSTLKPTVVDLFNYDILGTVIGSRYDRDTMIQMQQGIEAIWPLFPAYGDFFFELVYQSVSHKDFISFKDKFERVGTLKIKDGYKKSGTIGGISDFKRFEDIFGDYENEQKVFGYKKFPVKLMCEI